MNEVPLIEKVQKNDINTTIIAIKKQLKELNALLGLIDIQSDKQDLSPYVRKDEVIDKVKRFDLSPVTSNAVANALSYSTEETLTGETWIDGKPIYKRTIEHTLITNVTYNWQGTTKVIQDIETLVKVENVIGEDNGRVNVPILFKYGANNLQFFQIYRFEGYYTVTCFYTKTTD